MKDAHQSRVARVARVALPGAAVAALIAVQIALPEPGQSLLWSEAFNAGHAPLYGLVALAFLALLRRRGSGPGRSGIRPYLQSLALTVAAGILAECIQALGATAFLLAASAFDHSVMHGRIRLPRRAALLMAVLLLLPAFIRLAESAVAMVQRDAAFPRFCDFDNSWERKFVLAQEADLERTRPPEGWGRHAGDRVGCLVFHEGTYPGLSIQTVHPDWTGYHVLVFDTYSQLPGPTQLVLSIHDIGHNSAYHDRFNRELTIVPGANHISIPLRDMQTAPQGREMDMSRICGLVIFADHPTEAFVLYFDAFHLE